MSLCAVAGGSILHQRAGAGHLIRFHPYRSLEHFPTKWMPIRRRKCGKFKNLESLAIATLLESTLARLMVRHPAHCLLGVDIGRRHHRGQDEVARRRQRVVFDVTHLPFAGRRMVPE